MNLNIEKIQEVQKYDGYYVLQNLILWTDFYQLYIKNVI